ncbi:MAG: type III pantothenate kinase, partial [Oscillospiraceae bacterium]|nr:type III pantothenate kinase [Oscillospiraceae bacterium]
TGSIISSVVPPLTNQIRSIVRRLTGTNALVVGAGIKTGLNVLIENPASLGADIVAGSVAAMSKYPLPVIICDMGTATTIVTVDKHANYIGGAILPGVAISMNALSGGTSQLQRVSIEAPKKCINTVTVEAMKSGAVFGTASMIDGMIDRFEEELGMQCSVVATGGLAPMIVKYCKHDVIIDENLLLRGLEIIYNKNKR